MRGDRSRSAVVYLVTNAVNGKRYIGVTSKKITRRMSEHFCHAMKARHNGSFYRAIRKYGRDVFAATILESCKTCDEALAAEIRLIAQLAPEYNSTLGGDGRLGGYLTEEGRARLSAFHKGKAWHLGRMHGATTKTRLREAQANPDAIARWQKNAVLGPKAAARPVVCIDTGVSFESASAAARACNVPKSAVIEICLGRKYRKSIGGLRFKYAEAA